MNPKKQLTVSVENQIIDSDENINEILLGNLEKAVELINDEETLF